MGSKLSCCFRVKKNPPAAEQELEALRDIQVEIDSTFVQQPLTLPHSTIPENTCFMLDINLGAASTIYISAKVLFVKSLPSQVPRREPPPPLVVVCPPPSPRLANVHDEEELDFRNSSTLCLWSWDPRESGHKESGIPVEVNDAHRRV